MVVYKHNGIKLFLKKHFDFDLNKYFLDNIDLVTDYEHTKTKLLILFSPNSNANPK